MNENIGLTAVHEIFHSEHNRLFAQTKATVQANLDAGDISFVNDWLLPGVVLTPGTAIADTQWNGERLFQAAKFGTEMQYQHLVFEEFARNVAPAIHLAGGVNIHIDPAITLGVRQRRLSLRPFDAEREHRPLCARRRRQAGHRAGHRPAADDAGRPDRGLPQSDAVRQRRRHMTADIVLGTVNQVGNEIDEFVTEALRNNLLGLPLDLAALNIARGRDTGMPSLNVARAQLYRQTRRQPAQALHELGRLRQPLKHPESLVNFIAAYGTHAASPAPPRWPPSGRRAGAGQQRDARQRDLQRRCLQLPEQPGRLGQQQG